MGNGVKLWLAEAAGVFDSDELESVTVTELDDIAFNVVVASPPVTSTPSFEPIVTVVCLVCVLTIFVVVLTLALDCGRVAPSSLQTLSTNLLPKIAANKLLSSASTPLQKLFNFASILRKAC